MSFTQSTEMCLFLSFVVIVLIQENTCEMDSSSKDDPKSVDAVSSSIPSSGSDLKFFLTKDDSPESLEIKDDSGHAPKRVYNLSPTNLQLRRSSCNHGQKPMFLLHPWKKQTYVGCYNDKKIHGYCPELNAQGVQRNLNAPCKICDASYIASEGYKFPKCFEIYGGISSPYEREPCRCKIPATPTCTTLLIEETYVICLIVLNSVLVVAIFVIFLILSFKCCARRCTWCKKRPNKQLTVQKTSDFSVWPKSV